MTYPVVPHENGMNSEYLEIAVPGTSIENSNYPVVDPLEIKSEIKPEITAILSHEHAQKIKEFCEPPNNTCNSDFTSNQAVEKIPCPKCKKMIKPYSLKKHINRNACTKELNKLTLDINELAEMKRRKATERKQKSRKKMSDEQKERSNEERRTKYMNMTDEQKERDKEAIRKSRNNMTDEQKERQRERNTEARRKLRNNMTDEQKDRRKENKQYLEWSK